MRNLCVFFVLLVLGISSCQKAIDSTGDESSKLSQDSAQYHTLFIDGERIVIKQSADKYYFSDHEILSARQFNYLKHLSRSKLDSVQRSTIISDLAKRWTNGIVYYKISYPEREARIKEAMDHIALRTKIRFLERTSQGDYVEFIVSPDLGVSSSQQIGREGGRNYLKISPNAGKGVIVHEILHALGVFHEQSRSDRGNHININYENMNNNTQTYHQFNIMPGSVAGGSFDFQSIMMYGSYFFSNNGLPTITKLNGDTIREQRVGMSVGDVNGINGLYGTGPSIFGKDGFCSSSVYTVNGLLPGASVVWNVFPSGIVTTSGSGASVSLNKISSFQGNVLVTLRGTLTKGSEVYAIQKYVRVGGMINLDGIWTQSETNSTNRGMFLPFVALFPDRCMAQNAEWEVSPSTATISYNSGFPCENSNNTAVAISFHSPGNYTVKCRVKNECGFWSNYAFKYITVH